MVAEDDGAVIVTGMCLSAVAATERRIQWTIHPAAAAAEVIRRHQTDPRVRAVQCAASSNHCAVISQWLAVWSLPTGTASAGALL